MSHSSYVANKNISITGKCCKSYDWMRLSKNANKIIFLHPQNLSKLSHWITDKWSKKEEKDEREGNELFI